jgi:cell division protein FtsZ
MTNLDFDMPQNQSSTIKVIGVGGGGSNAVNYMYEKGIRGVDFVVCNTDQQALDDSPVPNKIQLGVSVTKGLGAGADPLHGKFAAEENIADVIAVLESNTEMVFINAGMGGGTGTGAAPVIAKAAKEMGILTVAIVTIPFEFEGGLRMSQAKEGLEELKPHVDSLIVINNNKLREIYGNLGFKSGFAKADEILATASRGIAEVITQKGYLNIDLNDVRTVLANSGTAIMGSGTASGDDRALKAVKGAIESPLLDNNHIRGAKKVLLLIVSGTEEVTFEEMGLISDFIQEQVKIDGATPADIIMGVAEDEGLGDAVNVTVVATGFHEGKAVNPFTGTLINVVHDLNGTEPSKLAINKPISEPTMSTPIEPDTIEVKHVLVDEVVEERIVDPVATPIEEKLVDIASPIDQMSPRLTNLAEDRQQVSMTFEFEIEEPIIENTITETSEQFELNSEVIEEIAEVQSEVETESFSITEESEITFSIDDFEETEELTQSVDSENNVVFSLDDEPVSSEVPSPLTEATESVSPSEKIVHTLSFDEEEDAIGEPTSEIEEEPILAMSISSKPVESIASHEYQESGDSVLVEPAIEEEIVVDSKPEAIERPIVSEEQSSVTLSSHSDTFQEQIERAQKRKERLHKFNYRFRNNAVIDNVEREPAYKRQGVQLNDSVHSTDEPLSRMSLSTSESGEVELKSRNSFLHDNVD